MSKTIVEHFDDEPIVSMRYVSQNKFSLNKIDIEEILGELQSGDNLIVVIKSINKYNRNGDSK